MKCERCNSGEGSLVYYDSFDCKERICTNCFEKLTGTKIKDKRISLDMFLDKYSKEDFKKLLEESLPEVN